MPFIPTQSFETGFDDINHVENDINILFSTYITPIDNIRSISRPAASHSISKSNEDNTNSVTNNNFSQINIDNNNFLESRTHAFYRMLGFPVVVNSGDFYNPGFPFIFGNINDKQNINDKFFDSSLQTLINKRETLPIELKNIFVRQDINSSIYALILRYTKPFNVIKAGGQPLDIDPQYFTVDTRNSMFEFFLLENPQLLGPVLGSTTFFAKTVVGQNLSGGQHILKPFVTDPRIVTTVMPDKNMIAVPFLKDKFALQIENNVFAQRPGIELIIRQRLSNQAQDKTFLNDVKKIISGSLEPGTNISSIDFETLRNVVSALADDNSLHGDDVLNLLNGFTSIQIITTSNLLKIIKSVIKKLSEAIFKIDQAKTKINWVPLPSIEGPESGAKGAVLSRAGISSTNSEIDVKITELRIKKLNAERALTEQNDLGNFASPFSGNAGGENTSLYEDQLHELIQKRDKIANTAFKAMGEVEIITGEISGLGLIDILAIYTALWAIDIKSLIGLLDEDSFQRLIKNNPDLKAVATQARGTTVLSSLNDFEQKLINILSFSDSLLHKQLASPLEESDGGTI